ncbi:MAG: helix-turn-helix domain-containing protein [Nanoarchaeota archaeon]|nr:helix-turn-helix domain-containing protein [Nanoarchaeota archaeon]
MDTSILEDLGLSKGEIKVYLVLLELGSTKVGQVIEKSRMASSAVHNALNTLTVKGLVTFIKKGKVKYYAAVSPKRLVEFIDEKKRRVLKILPELELKQKLAKQKEEAEVFVGFKGVTSMINYTLDTLKKGDDCLFLAASGSVTLSDSIHKFYKKYDLRRIEKGVKVKGISKKKDKHYFEARLNEGAKMEIHYTDLPFPSGINFGKDCIAITSWGDVPVGYLIKSKKITAAFKELFYSLWKS